MLSMIEFGFVCHEIFFIVFQASAKVNVIKSTPSMYM